VVPSVDHHADSDNSAEQMANELTRTTPAEGERENSADCYLQYDDQRADSEPHANPKSSAVHDTAERDPDVWMTDVESPWL
jgi:hypothetical protein